MNRHRLPLQFSVNKDRTLDTMEAVLAIARRGGLRLGALQLQGATGQDSVFVELIAPDPDLLDLFLARLSNLVDVTAIEKVACMHVA